MLYFTLPAAPPPPRPLGPAFSGTNPAGRRIGFTDRSMTVDGAPFLAVLGEVHYHRIDPDLWEDTLRKARAGGVNILSSYVFWNVHEEEEGIYRFDGCRDLRAFVQLCGRYGMPLILRVGPFCHGEMRNGGLPDWLYGKPYEARSLDAGFLAKVRLYFRALHRQLQGLYYGEGGPVIALQLDNEYMHAAASWEPTVATAWEWVPGGHDGEAYLRALHRILREEGMVTPFYTCTAWGGAMAPVDIALPLWSGYSYQPWLFNPGPGGTAPQRHPPTPEYLYRDNHNDAVPQNYEFYPRYAPASRPYACCEMMGGMACTWRYRFALPWAAVDALANIKLGSGCTLPGYYMYRGGSTPGGVRVPHLNEGALPAINYDFQAPLGQYGQPRLSWHRLRLLHLLCAQFAPLLCEAATALPDGYDPAAADPTDPAPLRAAVRCRGREGLLFLNNFQDHCPLPARQNDGVTLRLPGGGTVTFTGLGLASGENAILPFNLAMDGAVLRWASAQPVTRVADGAQIGWFFFAPAGMAPQYAFAADSVAAVEGCDCEAAGDLLLCRPAPDATTAFTVHPRRGAPLLVVTLTRADSLGLYKLETPDGRQAALWSDAALLGDAGALAAQTEAASFTVCAWPPAALPVPAVGGAVAAVTPAAVGPLTGYTAALAPALAARTPVVPAPLAADRYALTLPPAALTGHKLVLLRVRYRANIARLFCDGVLLNDDFCNGRPWDTRVDTLGSAAGPLVLKLAPGAPPLEDPPARWAALPPDGAVVEDAVLVPVNEVPLGALWPT